MESEQRGSGRSEGEVCDALEETLLSIVQAAPDVSRMKLWISAMNALELAHLTAFSEQVGADERIGLCCAIERVLELLGEGAADPGVALPALAMAAHTARGSVPAAWTAARYELETLLPVPGQSAAARRTLDVPVANLVRRASGDLATLAPAAVSYFDVQAERLGRTWPKPVRQRVMAARKRLRDLGLNRSSK